MPLRFMYLHTMLLLSFCIAQLGVKAQATQTQVDELNATLWEIIFRHPDSVIAIGNNIISCSKKLNYTKGEADAKARMGVAYDLKGQPDKALPYFLEAIKLQEDIRDSTGLAFSYNNLGLMYYAQYTYPKALENISKSLYIDEALGNKKGAAGSLVNMGIIYTYLDSTERSMHLYDKALRFYSDIADSAGIMVAYINMAKIYYARRQYTKALEYYLMNEKFLMSNPHPERISAAYNSLANTYLGLKNYNKALEYGHKDLDICSANQLTNRRQFAYETLNEIYFAKNDLAKAHDYLKKYTSLRDSIINEDKNASIAEIQTKYETEKKDKELLRIGLENEKAIEKNSSQKMLMIIFSLVFFVILIFIYAAYRSKQKINNLLSEKNKLNEEIIAQKDVMMGEIHHRVKNNLQLINSIIGLETKNFNDEQSASIVGYIQKRVNAIALLHQLLYEKEALDHVSMQPYLEQLCDGLKRSFGTPGKTVQIDYRLSNIRLDVNTSVPLGLIVNELVTNCFKYAFTGNGNICIELFLQENCLILKVTDNGTGISEANNKETFGFKMIRSLCRQLDAKWDTENNNGLSNIFTIKRFKTF